MNNADILSILCKSDEYVSGEELAKTFSISRAAISKRIEKLREKGIEIDSITNKGYKLIALPQKIVEESVLVKIESNKIIGNQLKVFEEIDSTNEYVKSVAKSNEEGFVAVANVQTKGKGRRGRSFASQKGGLYFTILMKPKVSMEKVPFLTQISACSIYSALSDMGVQTKIKWPNDIILNDKKIAGILCEMSCEMDYLSYVISGMGINIGIVEFDEEVSKVATSLEKEGYKISQVELFSNILKWFDYYYDKFKKYDYNDMVKVLRENSYILGKDIQVITASETKTAKAVDIDENGFLIVKYSDNTIEYLNYGEISVRKI